MGEILSVSNLTKYYGSYKGIEDVSFSLDKGKILGFIGPNGAGKSTTIRTILGLMSPTKGSINIFGEVLTQKRLPDVLKRIGYMSSEAKVYENMKVKDILNLALKLSGNSKTAKGYQKHLVKLFDVPLEKRFRELSFGNRKKVSIVTALQNKPELLILDEPTNGLDPLMQANFFKEIIKLKSEENITVLLSSHNLKEIENYCDDMMFIRDGQLIDTKKINKILGQTYTKVIFHEKVNIKTIKGMTIQSQESSKTTCLYSGDTLTLFKALLDIKVHDVEITKPNLEELFMVLYGEEGDIR
jgi:ABC-2 type transport system ATP-binding protein